MLEEVEAFLASGGRIRRFEERATSDRYELMDWLSRQGLSTKSIGGGNMMIGRRRVNLAGLYDIANELRRKQGLEPFCIGKSQARKQTMRF